MSDLVMDAGQNRYHLSLQRTVYTRFQPALRRITSPEPGGMDDFLHLLQEKLDEKRDENDNLPDTLTLNDLL